MSPEAGAIGGSADEAGGLFRAGVAAWLVAHGLARQSVSGLHLATDAGIPEAVTFETDDPLDDIAVTLNGGGRVYFQSKRSLSMSSDSKSVLAAVVTQLKMAIRKAGLRPDSDRLVIVAEETGPLAALRDGLQRRRKPPAVAGSMSGDEAASLKILDGHLADTTFDEQRLLIEVLDVLLLDVLRETSPHRLAGIAYMDGVVVAKGQGARAWDAIMAETRRLAERRQGNTLAEWRTVLRSGGLNVLDRGSHVAKAPRLTVHALEPDTASAQIWDGHSVGLGRLAIPAFPVRSFGVRIECAADGPSATNCLVRLFCDGQGVQLADGSDLYAGDHRVVEIARVMGTRRRLLLEVLGRAESAVSVGGSVTVTVVALSMNGGRATLDVPVALDPTYSPSLADGARQVLRLVLDFVHATHAFPKRDPFRQRHHDLLEVIDAVERDGWIQDWWGFYYLSPQGWAACDSDSSRGDFAEAEFVIRQLKSVYASTVDVRMKQWSTPEIADAIGRDRATTGRALVLMMQADLLWEPMPDENGLVRSFRLRESCLRPEALIAKLTESKTPP